MLIPAPHVLANLITTMTLRLNQGRLRIHQKLHTPLKLPREKMTEGNHHILWVTENVHSTLTALSIDNR